MLGQCTTTKPPRQPDRLNVVLEKQYKSLDRLQSIHGRLGLSKPVNEAKSVMENPACVDDKANLIMDLQNKINDELEEVQIFLESI